MKIGLVSDTHGQFDPALARLFTGCELILHAGDVGTQEVLDALGRSAPVRAVRGNTDMGGFSAELPATDVVHLGLLRAFLIHALGSPENPVPAARRPMAQARSEIVVFGHSHRPLTVFQDGVLYVNPGSAGPRRFDLPRAAGLLDVRGRDVAVTLYELTPSGTAPLAPPLEATL